jgi:lipid-A-disaccharide synthase
MARTVLISAGESSGDAYAAWFLEALRERLPDARFFGCAGERLRAAGCEATVAAESIAVVGLAEVLADIPRVWRQYRRLLAEAARRRPDLAVLVDAPDFNLRLARHLHRAGVPVLYLVAPQVWAWRPWRVRQIRRRVDHLLCIFPFEEAWFRERGLSIEYIGHPLVGRVRPQWDRQEFFAQQGLDAGRPLLALLPGSRRGEAARNLPLMLAAAARCRAQALIAVPIHGLPGLHGLQGIPIVRGLTYDAIAHADVALVASGTATIEAALLGTPMVVVYRVTEPSWCLGRLLVRTPFYSMVNLVAGRPVVPELIQHRFTAERAAAEVERLLSSDAERATMRAGLNEVACKLSSVSNPMATAAQRAMALLAAGRPVKEVTSDQ